ncbi:hypothetical protein [Burkholderia ubonensis]|nr:hypothetical protein [Burkholderia ubonensis]
MTEQASSRWRLETIAVHGAYRPGERVGERQWWGRSGGRVAG